MAPPIFSLGHYVALDNNLTVDYKLEQADFFAFAEENRRFVPVSLSRLYYFVVLPVLGVGLALETQSFTTGTVFTVLFMLASWFMQDRIRRAYRRAAYSEDNLSIYRRRWTATLTEEGLRLSSDAADSLYRWPFIRNAYKGDHYVHIVMTRLQKVRIPIRAFRDEQHLNAFIGKAQSYIKTPTT